MSATGRPPKKRDNYMADAQALLILTRAIESDTRFTVERQTRILTNLRSIVQDLLQEPKPLTTNENERTIKEP